MSTTKNKAKSFFTIFVLFLINVYLTTYFLGLAPQGCFVALPSLRSEKTLGRVLASRFPKSVQMLRIFTEIWHSVVLGSQNTFASTISTYVRARDARPYEWLRLYNLLYLYGWLFLLIHYFQMPSCLP